MLVIGSSGTLEKQRTASGFAKHYGAGGVALMPEPEPEPKQADEKAEPTTDFKLKPVLPGADVLEAIEQTALRYAAHPALPKVGLTVTDWMAFFQANIEIESAYNPAARSGAGAFGLGQLMPATAEFLGVDRTDVHQNLDGSARYLLLMLEEFQSKELALAGYNAGPQAVHDHGGLPPFKETKGHVAKVMATFQRLKGDNS